MERTEAGFAYEISSSQPRRNTLSDFLRGSVTEEPSTGRRSSASSVQTNASGVPFNYANHCQHPPGCETTFYISGRHHCRKCGISVCSSHCCLNVHAGTETWSRLCIPCNQLVFRENQTMGLSVEVGGVHGHESMITPGSVISNRTGSFSSIGSLDRADRISVGGVDHRTGIAAIEPNSGILPQQNHQQQQQQHRWSFRSALSGSSTVGDDPAEDLSLAAANPTAYNMAEFMEPDSDDEIDEEEDDGAVEEIGVDAEGAHWQNTQHNHSMLSYRHENMEPSFEPDLTNGIHADHLCQQHQHQQQYQQHQQQDLQQQHQQQQHSSKDYASGIAVPAIDTNDAKETAKPPAGASRFGQDDSHASCSVPLDGASSSTATTATVSHTEPQDRNPTARAAAATAATADTTDTTAAAAAADTDIDINIVAAAAPVTSNIALGFGVGTTALIATTAALVTGTVGIACYYYFIMRAKK